MLASVWFFIWGLLWVVYFITDGYNLGLSSLLWVTGRNEADRRLVLGTMAPFWDPNQVWLIAAGGMTFAVFPAVYATLFSALYPAMMLILFGLIFRSVAFELRGKSAVPAWKRFWDICVVVGSFLPTVLLGVFFTNLFRGLPLDAEGILHGGFITVINPYGLLGGLLFLVLFGQHGLIWLAAKTDRPMFDRAMGWAKKAWWAVLVVLVTFLTASVFATKLYVNYLQYPILLLLPVLAVAALILVRVYLAKKAAWKTFFASSALIALVTMTALAGLFPNVVPSTLTPAGTLTVYNAASSDLTLKIMLVVAIIFVPLVILYQTWANIIFKNKVQAGEEY
jgi:cytochrome d ubiquinol oxidase subunit II